MPSPARAERPSALGLALLAAVAVYLGLVLALPLGALVVRAVTAAVAAGGEGLFGAVARGAAWRTLVLAVLAVAVNAVVGVALALILTRERFHLRPVLDALVDAPLAVSPVMAGLGLLLVFGRNGLLAPVVERLGWTVSFAFPGLVFATLFVTLPFTVREVGHVLRELGTGEEDAAATLGATVRQTFFRVTFPNIRRALTVGVTLTAARALGEFGAVLVIGGAISGRTDTSTTFIFAAMDERQEAAAYNMALALALASVALYVVLRRARRTAER